MTTHSGSAPQRRTRSLTTMTALTAITAITALALSACSGADEPEEPAPSTVETTETTASPTASPEDTDTPGPTAAPETSDTPVPEATETDTDPDLDDFTTGPQSTENFPDTDTTSEGWFPTGVRASAHEGYDRIVIDHAGSGHPGFLAEYTTEALAPGSGHPADQDAPLYLAVHAVGLAGPEDVDTDAALANGYTTTELSTEVATGVTTHLPFEAASSYYIGLDAERPFRVFTLEDPARLVIDIATD
ncbi:MAG: AMIN-like domain-containing (lipo)protein [Micrococcaceae bacterium]